MGCKKWPLCGDEDVLGHVGNWFKGWREMRSRFGEMLFIMPCLHNENSNRQLLLLQHFNKATDKGKLDRKVELDRLHGLLLKVQFLLCQQRNCWNPRRSADAVDVPKTFPCFVLRKEAGLHKWCLQSWEGGSSKFTEETNQLLKRVTKPRSNKHLPVVFTCLQRGFW